MDERLTVQLAFVLTWYACFLNYGAALLILVQLEGYSDH